MAMGQIGLSRSRERRLFLVFKKIVVKFITYYTLIHTLIIVTTELCL